MQKLGIHSSLKGTNHIIFEVTTIMNGGMRAKENRKKTFVHTHKDTNNHTPTQTHASTPNTLTHTHLEQEKKGNALDLSDAN